MSTNSKKTIREQSEEIWSEIHEAMLYVLEQEVPPAIMKADLQQEAVSELERLRGLGTYDNEILWYNALVAGNFIQKSVDAMQEKQQSSVERIQKSELLYEKAGPEREFIEGEKSNNDKMTEKEIVDILVDELWVKLPSEPFPEQVEFAILQAAMEIESKEDICIEDATLQRAISEYNYIMTGE